MDCSPEPPTQLTPYTSFFAEYNNSAEGSQVFFFFIFGWQDVMILRQAKYSTLAKFHKVALVTCPCNSNASMPYELMTETQTVVVIIFRR